MPKTYKVAIIGCGGMGHWHAQRLAEHKRTRVVAGMDINPEAAQKFAQAFQVPGYTNREEMLAKHKPDMVVVATWQDCRARITVEIAGSGILGILGEKPMAEGIGGCDDMIEACERYGVKLAIGHQRRFMPQNTEARRLIASGAIGQPQAMIRRDGEGLLNRGTHELDEMAYILGDPKPLWAIGQVSRKTDKWERRVRCEDLCMGEFCFEGGIRGVYESDLPQPGLRGDVVYGSDGQLRRGPQDTIELLDTKKLGWQTITPAPETDQHQEFVDWLDGKIELHRNHGRRAKVAMELMMAIYESLRIRDVVRFPLTTRPNPLDLMVDGGLLPVFKEGRYDIRAPFPEEKPKEGEARTPL